MNDTPRFVFCLFLSVLLFRFCPYLCILPPNLLLTHAFRHHVQCHKAIAQRRMWNSSYFGCHACHNILMRHAVLPREANGSTSPLSTSVWPEIDSPSIGPDTNARPSFRIANPLESNVLLPCLLFSDYKAKVLILFILPA